MNAGIGSSSVIKGGAGVAHTSRVESAAESNSTVEIWILTKYIYSDVGLVPSQLKGGRSNHLLQSFEFMSE